MLFSETKVLLLVTVVVFSLLFLLGFIFYVIYKNIKIRQNKEIEILDTIIVTQNNEQSRIADDLHDELAPLLSAIKLQLNNMQDLEPVNMSTIKACSMWLDKTIEDIRLISRNLSDKMIENNGLLASLEDSISLFMRQNQIVFDTQFDFIEDNVPALTKSNLYKIVMELVNNTVKHSNGDKVNLYIREDGKNLLIDYSDNGKKENQLIKKGIGTSNFVNRLRLINATIIEQSKDFSNGARYSFTIPLK